MEIMNRLAVGQLRVASAAVVMVVAVAVAVIGLSSALFTNETAVDANNFTAGTIDIAASPGTAALVVPNMAPGDKVTSTISVSNTGTLEHRYAVVSTSSENTLAAQLEMTVKSDVTSCNNAGFAGSGTIIYGSGDAGSTTGLKIIGDSTQGFDAGDRVLAASDSEDLCVQIELPISTPNSFQAASTSLEFAFFAEQTANN
jgi:hypothetical protein